MADKKISRPINGAQKTLLIEFLKKHEQLQTGKFTKDFTFKTAQKLWEEVAELLNSVPNGASKDWKQWRKSWQDLKKNTKAKAAAVKKSFSETGGGEPAKELSTEENEILDLLSPSVTEGLAGVTEANVSFNIVEITEDDENMLGDHVPVNNAEYAVNEHAYSAEYPGTSSNGSVPQRMNKTSRLQSALKVSQGLLQSCSTRNDILDNYYQEKIIHMREDTAFKKKLLEGLQDAFSVQKEQLEILKSMKDVFTQYVESKGHHVP